MKNKISDLRNHMFAALERLADGDLTEAQIKLELEKAKAISDLGKVVVESAKTEVLYAKLTKNKELEPTKFLELDEPDKAPIIRPEAKYSNK